MTIVNQLQRPAIMLERTLGMPAEGPKAIPINLDFTSETAYTFDYTSMQQRTFISMVQTVWVDNSLSAAVLTITIPSSQQTLKIPAGIQGYFTVICPNPVKISFGSTGGVVCQVTLLNFPVLA
jgi:hypothetical protein